MAGRASTSRPTTRRGAAITEGVLSRRLAAGDAAAGHALSSEAGWNQTVADWQFMIAEGEAWGQVAPEGALIAASLILPYGGRLGWIAMVLTTASHRRHGFASANLRHAIARCDARGLTAGLDATPAGRAVYAPLGFRDLFGLHRLVAGRPALPRSRQSGIAIQRIATAADLDAAVALEAQASGIERRALLAYLRANQPGRALLALAGGRPSGLVLARTGNRSLHVGPLIAEDDATACALLAGAIAGDAGPVSIDVPDAQAGFLAFLAGAAFEAVRPFTRMLRNAPAPIGDAARCYAIAGPEFG